MSTEAAHTHGTAEASILKLALNLAGAGLIAGLILATINYFTEPIRIENERLAKIAARQEVLPAAKTYDPIEGLNEWFVGKDAEGKEVGYILNVQQRGYDGFISMMLGVDSDGAIVDYKILRDRETPGLGAKAKGEKFKKQFRKRKIEDLQLTKTQEEGKIQAITGATITSRAVMNGFIREMTNLKKMKASGFTEIPEELKAKGGKHE